MARTETHYDVFKNVSNFAMPVERGFQTLGQAKQSIIDLKVSKPGVYWVRKTVVTDYSAEDIGMIDDQS